MSMIISTPHNPCMFCFKCYHYQVSLGMLVTTFSYTHTHTHTPHTQTYTRTHTHTHTYTCTDTHTHISCKHTLTDAYAQRQTRTHMHAHTHLVTVPSLPSPTCAPSLPPTLWPPLPSYPHIPHSLQNMSCPPYLHTLCAQTPDTL